jgi:hypothetical protein
MRVWILYGLEAARGTALEGALRQWVRRPDARHWTLETRAAEAGLRPARTAPAPQVLVAADADLPAPSDCDGWFEEGVGLVVAVRPEGLTGAAQLAARWPVCFVPAAATAEELGLAVLAARAAAVRQSVWQESIAELRQRLADRVVIERAKGVLAQRLGVSEADAYKRLRVLARQQRRQLRDIAAALLDAETLLLPAAAAGAANPGG